MEQQADNLATALLLLSTFSKARALVGSLFPGATLTADAQTYVTDLFNNVEECFTTTANIIVELTPKTEETTTNTASL